MYISTVVVRKGIPERENVHPALQGQLALTLQIYLFMLRSALSAGSRPGAGGHWEEVSSFQPSWIGLIFASCGHLEAPLGTSLEIQMCNLSDCALKLNTLIFVFKASMVKMNTNNFNFFKIYLLTWHREQKHHDKLRDNRKKKRKIFICTINGTLHLLSVQGLCIFILCWALWIVQPALRTGNR